MISPVTQYYTKHRELILENLNLSRSENIIEPIHDMRVSFKRLIILLQFLEQLSDGGLIAKKEYQHFNNFYKKSGRLRDLHVQYQLLAKYIQQTSRSYQEYDNYLKERIIKREIKYLESLDKFQTDFFNDLGKKCSSIIQQTDQKDLGNIARSLLVSKCADIFTAYHQQDGEKRFHNIRRFMKELQYLNNILNNELPLESHLNINAERLSEVGQLLGAWHDKLTAEYFLMGYLSKYHNKIESPDAYSSLLELIRHEKNDEYQQLDNIFIDEVQL